MRLRRNAYTVLAAEQRVRRTPCSFCRTHFLRGSLMAFFRRLSVTGAAVAMLGACSTLSGPANVVEVSVGAATFERIGTPAIATVPFSVTNRGSAAAFVARCDSRVMAAVDRWNGQSWVQYSGDACPAIYTTAALEIIPGASAAGSQSVLEPGKYRLRVGTVDASNSGLDWSIVSSQFEVR